jgi:hypothetical protein
MLHSPVLQPVPSQQAHYLEGMQGVRLLERRRMAMGTKKWLVRVLQSLGISAVIWVIAWLWGGVNFAFGVLAIAIVLGILGVLIT